MNSKKYKDFLYQVREIDDLKEMLLGSVKLYGDDPAIYEKNKDTKKFEPKTYSELLMDINGLGTTFIKKGMKGKKIAIIGENSYKWVVSYFSIVNGTGVVVPIDRELKPEEIGNLLKRSGAAAVIYSKKLKSKVEEIMYKPEYCSGIEMFIRMDIEEDEGDVLSFDKLMKEGKEEVLKGNTEFIDAKIDKDKLAVLLFTSGTTGLAKGVMLSHSNIASNVYNMSKYVQISQGSIGLSVLPMHHTYEMTCHIMTALYQGVSIAICQGLKHIQENMAEIPANVMLAVPLIFETMHKKVMKTAAKNGLEKKVQKGIKLSNKLKLYNRGEVTKKLFAQVHEVFGNSIELFIAGGAAINPQVIEDFQAMGFPMIQGYGMTENAPIIAVNKDCYSKPHSVGLPMPGTEIRIEDPDEDGVGEIAIKGPSVMLGYYENDEATRETIVDGWLKTGDYGYMDKDGFLYVTGRKKSVIVTKNGKNIFPEEVEYYLESYDFVEEVLVHGIDGARNDDVIVKAEIFPNYDLIKEVNGDLSEDQLEKLFNDIIEEVNEKVPNYKRIKRFHLRKTEFEKTTTRKIKRFLPSNLNEDVDK